MDPTLQLVVFITVGSFPSVVNHAPFVDSLAGSNSSTSVPPQNGTPVNAPYTSNKPAATVDYLTQLLKDKKQLAAFPNVFIHLERLVDDGELFVISVFA